MRHYHRILVRFFFQICNQLLASICICLAVDAENLFYVLIYVIIMTVTVATYLWTDGWPRMNPWCRAIFSFSILRKLNTTIANFPAFGFSGPTADYLDLFFRR